MASSKSTKSLSSLTLNNLKSGELIADSGEYRGLRVSCGKSGVKTFIYRYRSPTTEKIKQYKIGRYQSSKLKAVDGVDLLSLAQARVKFLELKALRDSGVCPVEQKQQQKDIETAKKLAEPVNSYTIENMIELYLTKNIEDRVVDGKTVAGARQRKGQIETRRTLTKGVVDFLGDRIASQVTRKEIVALIRKKVEQGYNVQAGNVLREFSAAYEYSIGLDYFDDYFANPALLAKASLRQAKISLTAKRGVRYLKDDEIKLLLGWLPGSAYTPTQKNILRFTLWTGCRTGEVCNAEWKDINLETGIWHLSKTKTSTERDVQLPTQAIAFLKQLKLTTGDYPFPSLKTGKPIQQKSLTEQSWQLRTSNRMLDIEKWTPHDLRRTVRSGLAKLGCRTEVAEAILGHSKGGIEGTYDLHKYDAECREWLQIWADHLDSLINNVVSLVVNHG